MNVRSWFGSVVFSAVAASIAAVGCSHQIDSPPLSAQGPVAPDLACVAQLTTAVTLNGSGFTPMPSKTLQTPEALILPSVTLTHEAQIDGTAVPATDAPVTINGDPASGPDSQHVHWTSSSQMSFDVWPSLSSATGLPSGLYDVAVTNPDGKQTASYPKSLGAVPPPSIKQLVPPALCDAESNQTIEIDGSYFLTWAAPEADGGTTNCSASNCPQIQVGTQTFTADSLQSCTAVPGTYVEGNVQECSVLVFTIPQGTFTVTSPQTFPVTVTNPTPIGAQANCASQDVVNLKVEPPPIVTSVVPDHVCSGGGQLTINGSNFVANPSVTLESTGDGGAASTTTSVTTNSGGTQLTANVSGPIPPGTYDVVVTNPDGCTDTPPHQTVTVIPGPIIYLAEPNVVYNGANFPVTVFMTTAFNATDTVYIVPTGKTTPQTPLTPQAVTGHADRFSVTIPSGQQAGVYDLVLDVPGGCGAILVKAITVVSQLTVTVKDVVPPFGGPTTETAVQIDRDQAAPAPGNYPFVATPTAWLYPHNSTTTSVPTELLGMSFIDKNTLDAIVPANMTPQVYDLIVADPDGNVGFLQNAFTVEATSPPVIDACVPSSIVAATGQNVTIYGQNFGTGATVSVTCTDSANNTYNLPVAANGTATATSIPVTINGSTLSGAAPPTTTAGTVCIVQVKNADGSYFQYSALGVTNSSFDLEKPPLVGIPTNTARRALVSSAIKATDTARFIYAIGGDTGTATEATPRADSEFIAVNLYGQMTSATGKWTTQAYSMPSGRSFAGVATLGRYTYVLGGTTDNTNAASTLDAALRAITLSPLETPGLDVDDIYLCPGSGGCTTGPGLAGGFWYYKVSAVFSNADPDNPGGESLPSAEQPIELPVLTGFTYDVKLTWSAPVDSLGVPLPNVVGYDVYRTAAVNGTSNGEVLLTATPVTGTTFVDDGSQTPGARAPLPLGSMGEWAALPNMAVRRKGLAGLAGADPSATCPTAFPCAGSYYVYALLGLDQTTTARTDYEILPITVATNGHQTVGAWKTGANKVANGRWQLGAWAQDFTVNTGISSTAPKSYVYLGGGIDGASANVTDVDVSAAIAAGGDLGALSIVTDTNGAAKSFSTNHIGYAAVAATQQLYTFGGVAMSGGTPQASSTKAQLTSTAAKIPDFAIAPGAWSNEGITLNSPRYLMGYTEQSAFIFLIGGDSGGGTATATTESIIW